MKFLRQGIALAFVGAGLAAVPAMQVQAQAAEPSLVQQMKDKAQGSVDVAKESATGRVGFIQLEGPGDLMPDAKGNSATAAAEKADAYLDEFAAGFGARASELKQEEVEKSSVGWTVTYTQEFQGVPVFGSMIRANVDKQGDLTAVNGYAAPNLALDTTPARSAASAGAIAVGTVRALPPGEDGQADTTGIKAVANDLAIYRMGSTTGKAGKPVLVHVVEVSNGTNIRDMVFVDATTGKVVNRYSMIHDALDRELYEATGTAEDPVLTKVWEENDPFPGTLDEDQQNEVDGTGDAYWFFKNVFDRDSYDGAGHTMVTVNNDPRIACPNANWNGQTTNYCSGVSSDDVVAHEWGHAYTEKTHGLIYQWQSGALNESYSDIWGETVDLINEKQDAGEGDLETKRPDGECSTHTRGEISMVINSPVGAAGPCTAVAAAFGPVFDTTGVTDDVVVATDPVEPAPGSTATDGCSPFTNAGAVAGNFVYVDRGVCTFAVKVANAETAGATGIIVGDNVAGRDPTAMSGDADIYGAMVTLADGARIKAAGTVNATIQDADTAPKADSYRWLIGEKSTAFGGAIRDMWNPTCYGDPGKVSDTEYFCGTDDGGGVHSNSAVPNHGYSLLVDGGDYNGVTVTGIGLDKAAAIYYRAMTFYQTPTTDFVDHADALAASCNDLVGQPINTLTVAPNATPTPATPVAAADCTQVANMAAAVELRKEPVQCNYQPLFDQDTPAACGAGFTEEVLWSEDFEDGLAGWGTDQDIVFDGGLAKEWTTVNNPEGHASRVAHGDLDGQIGQCVGDAGGDYSSRDSIVSPVVELPAGTLLAPQLSFEHSVASELDVDGGNVKVSVNGRAFETVPAAAYSFNAPGVLLPAGAGNTNPLAGQAAFTGSDAGSNITAWGTSVIDIAALGIDGGDTVQFRLDVGRDGCGGVTGWSVDNLKLVQCKLAAKVSAVHLPEPSTFGEASAVKVTVERNGSVGTAPTGDVTLEKADGTAVGTGTLSGGTTTIALPADLPVGVHAMTARYAGDATITAATDLVTVTVKAGPAPVRTESTTDLKMFPKKPRFKDDLKGVAKIKAADRSDVTGKVRFLLDGKVIGTRTLDDGRADLKIKKNLKVGKHKLVAVYLGSDSVEGSRDKVQFKVVRR